MAGLAINGRPGKSNVVSLARHPWCPSDSPKHHRFYLPFTGKPPKNRTTAQWANVFRHCCKVIDLNSLPLGKATGSFGKTILAWDRSHCWCFSCRCLSIFRKALIVEKNGEKMEKHVSATQLCTVRYGLRSRFSSGNDTGLFSRSRDLPQIVRSWQWDMPFSLSHGPSGVLKALQLKYKNWRAVMKPEWNGQTKKVVFHEAVWQNSAKLWHACQVAPVSWRLPCAWKLRFKLNFTEISLEVSYYIWDIHNSWLITIDPNLGLQLFATVTVPRIFGAQFLFLNKHLEEPNQINFTSKTVDHNKKNWWEILDPGWRMKIIWN